MKVYDLPYPNMLVLLSRARCNHYFSGREVRIWRPESVSILRSAKTIVLQGCDVINRLRNTSVMADKRFSRGREKLSVACGRFVMSFKDRIFTWRISTSCCSKWKELRTKEDSFCPYKQLPVGKPIRPRTQR